MKLSTMPHLTTAASPPITRNCCSPSLSSTLLCRIAESSVLLDGTFPPYRHLLPQEVTTTALIEVATLLDSVRRVALVTDKTVPLRLDFNNNTLSLEAGAGEEAQATEAIEILLTGEPISIAFNPTFLADGLNAVQTKFVQISFTGSNKPAILMGKSDKDGALVENYRYLLMPMRYAS